MGKAYKHIHNHVDMDTTLVEEGYTKDRPMHVTKGTILEVIYETEDVFGFKRGKHRFNLSHNVTTPFSRAEYNPYTNTFASPQENSRVVLSHESTHYLVYRRGVFFSTRDSTLYGGLLDEIIADMAPLQLYDYDHKFRL